MWAQSAVGRCGETDPVDDRLSGGGTARGATGSGDGSGFLGGGVAGNPGTWKPMVTERAQAAC